MSKTLRGNTPDEELDGGDSEDWDDSDDSDGSDSSDAAEYSDDGSNEAVDSDGNSFHERGSVEAMLANYPH